MRLPKAAVGGTTATIVADYLRDGLAAQWLGWGVFGATYAAVTSLLRDAG